MIALDMSVDEIHDLYKNFVPDIIKPKKLDDRSARLAELAKQIFKDANFDDVRTAVGVITTNWDIERPMIF